MASYKNAGLIRILKQISRDKTVPVNLRVRCCELLVLIDPAITFNVFARAPWVGNSKEDGEQSEVVDEPQ